MNCQQCGFSFIPKKFEGHCKSCGVSLDSTVQRKIRAEKKFELLKVILPANISKNYKTVNSQLEHILNALYGTIKEYNAYENE